MPLHNWFSIHARWSKSIPYVSVAFFPGLKLNFIAYRSSKVSDCIFEIHRLWQSGFSRVYSNRCCSCSFEREIIKIGQWSHKIYSNMILNFQESTTILNAHTKKVWKPIVCTSYVVLIKIKDMASKKIGLQIRTMSFMSELQRIVIRGNCVKDHTVRLWALRVISGPHVRDTCSKAENNGQRIFETFSRGEGSFVTGNWVAKTFRCENKMEDFQLCPN